MNGRNDEREIEDDGFYTVSFDERAYDASKEVIACEGCEGTGEVRRTLFNSLHPDNWTTCKVCNGTGELSETQCERCGFDLESEHPGILYTCPVCSGVA